MLQHRTWLLHSRERLSLTKQRAAEVYHATHRNMLPKNKAANNSIDATMLLKEEQGVKSLCVWAIMAEAFWSSRLALGLEGGGGACVCVCCQTALPAVCSAEAGSCGDARATSAALPDSLAAASVRARLMTRMYRLNASRVT